MTPALAIVPRAELSCIDSLRAALQSLESIVETKEYLDRVRALQTFVRSSEQLRHRERDIALLRLRAERRAGEILAGLEMASGDLQNSSRLPEVTTTKLHEIGVSKRQSWKWQAIAALPQATFDSYLAEAPKPSTAGALRLARPPKVADPARASIDKALATLRAEANRWIAGTPTLNQVQLESVAFGLVSDLVRYRDFQSDIPEWMDGEDSAGDSDDPLAGDPTAAEDPAEESAA